MDAAEAKVITDAALLWERMSLKRGITPAGLTRFSEEARLLRDVLIAAGANVGDDTAGLTISCAASAVSSNVTAGGLPPKTPISRIF